jgi:AbrB family looped-hinge helix DNA binding protein
MKERVGVMTRKGQVTVPADIRRALGLKEGDKVTFTLVDAAHREVSLRPAQSIAERYYGAVPPRKRPEDFQELRREFEAGVAEEVLAEMAPPADDRA